VLDTLLFGVAIFFLLSNLFDTEFLKIVLSILATMILLCSIPLLKPLPKFYAITLYILGVLLFVVTDASLEEWLNSLEKNMGLLVLFILVPLIGIPIKYGEYIRNIGKLYDKFVTNIHRLHTVTGILSLLFSPVLTIAAISILKDLSPKLSGGMANKSFLTALSRSFGLTLCWTPYFASVIFILSLLNIEWITLVPYTLTFTLTAFLLSCLVEYHLMRRHGSKMITSDKSDIQLNWKKIFELIFILVLITLVLWVSITFLRWK
jgi:DcuC family C4-dicarboxylate transporter